ncbi:MAG: hypothetical protein LLF94_11655 [Chlamydiales bacterium]|nr:hypothetical protein [Chlamydiales bacterium]
MKLITFATVEEAEHTLATFDAQFIKTGLYQSTIGYIGITGIGPFAAAFAIQAIHNTYNIKEVINIGFAGSLNPKLELGSIWPISSCSKHLWHPKGHIAAQNCLANEITTLALQTDGVSLSTVDFPLYETPAHLIDVCDLIDMEGYAIAQAALSLGLPCTLYKLVSDYCTSTSLSEIKNNMRKYSQIVSSFLNNKYNKG